MGYFTLLLPEFVEFPHSQNYIILNYFLSSVKRRIWGKRNINILKVVHNGMDV